MRAPFKKTTIREVAEMAGVSQGAISQYINGRQNVCSAETAERINRAIKELHFTPARAMRHQGRQATNTIGISVKLPSEDSVDSQYTYLNQFWSGLGAIVDDRSYCIKHFPKSMRDGASCNPFLDGSIDGLLISADALDRRLDVLADAGLPTVCVNRSINVPDAVGSVVSNEADVVSLAMSHLAGLGHRHIAYFGGFNGWAGTTVSPCDPITETAQFRHDEYLRHMSDCGLDGTEYAAFAGTFDFVMPEDALAAVDGWMAMAHPPTAVFCGSDRLAQSLVPAFRQRGIRVPEDVSIVGVDNEGPSALFDPPLTSVEVPVNEIGRRAATMLIGMITGTGAAQRIKVPVQKLVIRKSTDHCRVSAK